MRRCGVWQRVWGSRSKVLAIAGLTLALLAGLPHGLRADDGIPAETLAFLKDGTALVKVTWQFSGQKPAAGSAFILRRDKESALFITNAHVLAPPHPSWQMVGKPSLVLFSGTRRERVIEADVLAIDPERDLAVLKVSGQKDLPEPLPLPEKPEVRETMTVYIVGFPLGATLTLNDKHPAVTVSTGKVSSLRENDRGEVAMIQVDGNVNPGNSGGPVVDSKGRLAGVVRAKVRGTELGLAISAGELANMLLGRVSKVNIDRNKMTDDSVEMIATASLIDPLGKVREVWGYHRWSSASKTMTLRDAKGRWAPMADATKIEMKLDGDKAIGEIRAPRPKADEELQFQAVYVNGAGETHYLEPARIQVKSAIPTASSAEDESLRSLVGAVPVQDVTAAFRPQFEGLPNVDPPKVVVEQFNRKIITRLHCAAAGEALLLEEGALGAPTRLLLFDLSRREVTQAFRLPEPKTLFAVGKSHLFLFQPDRNLLERWSLATGKLEQKHNWSEDWKPLALAHGAATEGPLLIYGEDAKGGFGKWVDSANLERVKGRAKFPRMVGNRIDVRPFVVAADRAPVFVLAGSNEGMHELFVCKLRPEGGVDVSDTRKPFMLPVWPDADAKFFYGRGGGVYDAKGKSLVETFRSRPAAIGPGYTEYDRNAWSFRPSGVRFEAAKLRIARECHDYLWLSNRNQMACLTESMLHLITFDLRPALAKAEEQAGPASLAGVRSGKVLVGEPTGLMLVGDDGQEINLKMQDVELPWTHERLLATGGGRSLVFQDLDFPRAILFDPVKRQAVAEFDLEERHAQLAVSNKHLIGYLPESRRLKVWDVETQKLLDETSLKKDRLVAMAVGADSEGPLMLVTTQGDTGQGQVELVDPKNLDRSLATHTGRLFSNDPLPLRAMADGSMFFVGLLEPLTLTRKGTKYEAKLGSVAERRIVPLGDARQFKNPGTLLPAFGAPGSALRIETPSEPRGEISLPHRILFYRPGEVESRGALTGLAFRRAQATIGRKGVPLEERLIWLPRANLVVFTPEGLPKNTLRLITFDSQAILGPQEK